MARATCSTADAVFVVGLPGMKGTHALTRVIADLVGFGVAGANIVAVVNRAPRGARSRSEITDAINELLPTWAQGGAPGPVFLPDRHVDDALRDNVRLPDALAGPVLTALRSVTERAGRSTRPRPDAPQLVTPGALGRWTPELERQ